MMETSINYAKALYGLSVSGEAVEAVQQIFKTVPEVGTVLDNPLVSLKEKEQVVEKVFPKEVQNFLKVVCKYHKTEQIQEMIDAYGQLCQKQQGILQAKLYYVTKPTETQAEKMKEFLRREFSAKEVNLDFQEDKSLIGGFILRAEDLEYDWSLAGRYRKLQQKLTRR